MELIRITYLRENSDDEKSAVIKESQLGDIKMNCDIKILNIEPVQNVERDYILKWKKVFYYENKIAES